MVIASIVKIKDVLLKYNTLVSIVYFHFIVCHSIKLIIIHKYLETVFCLVD